MKKALISPQEVVTNFDSTTGIRVAQVEESSNIFEVAAPLYWIDCPDEVSADVYYYDNVQNKFVLVPPPPPPPPRANTANTVTANT